MMLVPLLTALAPLVVQDAPAPKTTPTTATPQAQASKPTVTTRADLARAYLRFETTLHDHPPKPERWPEINRAFDKLTMDFFLGNGAAAIRKLEELTASIHAPPSILAASTTVVLEMDRASGGSPRIVVTVRTAPSAASASTQAPPELVFRSWSYSDWFFDERTEIDQLRISWPLSKVAGPSTWIIPETEAARIMAAYDASLSLAEPCGWFVQEGHTLRALPYVFLDTPGYAATLTRIDETLRTVVPDGPPLEQALASCRARALLLRTPRSTDQSSIFLQDLHRFANSVEREAGALARGEDPYRRRADDHWRVVRVGDKDVPVRVFAPRPQKAGPRPLVVALHGAGGDENMFFDGYGAGRIQDLATDRDFVCVTPRVGFTGLSGETFDAIVRAMIYDHAIDPKRIYVLGHSMGAGAAYSLAVSRADTIAAVACIAGGAQGTPPQSIAPLLVVAGELDPIVNASGLEQGSQRLKSAGLPVQFELVKGFGHTLVVGERLPAVVDWLLSHTR